MSVVAALSATYPWSTDAGPAGQASVLDRSAVMCRACVGPGEDADTIRIYLLYNHSFNVTMLVLEFPLMFIICMVALCVSCFTQLLETGCEM